MSSPWGSVAFALCVDDEESVLERLRTRFQSDVGRQSRFSAPLADFYNRGPLGEGFWEPQERPGRPVTASCASGGAPGPLRDPLKNVLFRVWGPAGAPEGSWD